MISVWLSGLINPRPVLIYFVIDLTVVVVAAALFAACASMCVFSFVNWLRYSF